MTIYSNKMKVNVTQSSYPIKEVKLYVSTDGQNWSTSATGNSIYFKAECYDSNGNLADTTLEGVSNLGINVNNIPYTTKMIIGQLEGDAIYTSGGIAEWVNTGPQTMCETSWGSLIGSASVFIYAIPYPHPVNDTQINDNIYHPVASNNVSIAYEPVKWLSPTKMYINISPTPQIVNLNCLGTPGVFYYLEPNAVYTWTFKILDSNNNPVPYCPVSGLLILYLTGHLNDNTYTNSVIYNTDQNGEFSIKWTAPSTGKIPNMAPLFDTNFQIYFLGNSISNNDVNWNIFIGSPDQNLFSAYYSGITASVDDNGVQIIIKGPKGILAQVYAYDPSTKQISTTLSYSASVPTGIGYISENVTQNLESVVMSDGAGAFDYSIATVDLKGILISPIYLVLGPSCIASNFSSLPIIIGVPYGGVLVCYGRPTSNGSCEMY